MKVLCFDIIDATNLISKGGLEFEFLPDNLLLGDNYVGSFTDEDVCVYNFKGHKIFNKKMEDVIKVLEFKTNVFVIGESYVYDMGKDEVKETGFEIKDASLMNGTVVLSTGTSLINLFTEESVTVSQMVANYSQAGNGKPSGGKSPSNKKKKTKMTKIKCTSFAGDIPIEIVTLTPDYIVSTDNDIIFTDGFQVTEIISFNENISGCVERDDHLWIVTHGGYLKIGKKTNRIFYSKIVPISSHSISGIRLLNGEKCSECEKAHAEQKGNTQIGNLCFKGVVICTTGGEIFVNGFKNNVEGKICAMDATNVFLCVGTEEGQLIIFNISGGQCNIVNSLAVPEISAIKFSPNHLTVALYSSSVLFYNLKGDGEIQEQGSPLAEESPSNTILINKPLSIATNDKYIMIGGHKHIKILDAWNLTELQSYATKRPVLNCSITIVGDTPMFLAVSDICKLFTVAKPICYSDFTFVNGWSGDFPFIGSQDKISEVEIVAEEVRSKKDIEKHKDVLLLKNDLVGLMKVEEDERKQFQIINKEFSPEIFKACGNVGKMLVKNGQLKDAVLFNKIIKEVKYDRKYHKQIVKIVDKQKKGIKDLMGFLKNLEQ